MIHKKQNLHQTAAQRHIGRSSWGLCFVSLLFLVCSFILLVKLQTRLQCKETQLGDKSPFDLQFGEDAVDLRDSKYIKPISFHWWKINNAQCRIYLQNIQEGMEEERKVDPLLT